MYKLIIVDDEKLELKLLSKILNWEELGFTLVQAFNSATSALEYVSVNDVDLVITDIRMPEIDGIELATKIKELCPETLIIFISAYTDFEYAQKAIRLSVVDYILKPIVAQNVITAVESAKEILDSRFTDEDISDFTTLSAQQAVFEYFADNQPLDTLVSSLQNSGLHNISCNSSVATFKVTIEDFSGYLKNNWKYGADKAYFAFFNLISSDCFYCIPVNYLFDVINVIAISKDCSFNSFKEALTQQISNMCENALTILQATLKVEILSVGRNMMAELENAKNVYNFPLNTTIQTFSDSTAIQEAINYIKANYHKDISLTEIANHVYLSSYHFSKIFKAKTGEKYIDYLNKIRIEKSKELLAKSQMKVTDISIKVGYNSKTHFHKMFKLYTGITPQEYRNSYYKA